MKGERQMGKGARVTWLLAGVSALAIATPALAQPDETASVDEVVVTGSRIVRSTFETPTPVSAVTEQQLDAKAATAAVELLRDIPSIRPNQNNQPATDVGSSTFNMRSLGGFRTLVLIDGRRAMDTSPTGGFDLNILPAPLIKRIEIVTAGASSVYGSDAVTGVVNVMLDSEKDGGDVELQYTRTSHGDNPTYSASVAYGTGFAGGRGHVVGAASIFRNPDVLYVRERGWGRQGFTLIPNTAATAANGQPRTIIVPNVRLSQMTLGGVITTAGPLKNIQFGENGAQSLFQQGANVSTVWMQGGEGLMTQPDFAVIQPSADRDNAFARVTYDFSDTTQGFGEILYAQSRNNQTNIPNNNNADIVIRRDNAFLPANIRAIMVANNLQQFNMGRLNPETGINDNTTTYTYIRAAGGLKGELWGGWRWDLHLDYTHAVYKNESENNRIQANWTAALDSVIGPNGQPICRSTLTNPNNGCVPANPFGINAVSPAAVAYVTGTSWIKANADGVDVAANLTGNLFDTWAGPVAVAIGAEYRKEELDLKSDPISAINGWRQASSAPYSGQVSVKEAYAEAAIPLASDMTLAKRLELDLAGRVVDYSTSGTTAVWKAGVNWTLNDQIRFRGTYSRDFRAPKINELFSASTVRSGLTVIDRTTNSSVVVQVRTGGNPNLQPEKAYTLTGGVVVRPEFLPRLQLSADYFEIELKDAITLLANQEVVDRCFAGNQTLCASVIRDPATNRILLVEQVSFNAQILKTSGIDFEVSYATPLDEVVQSWDGNLSLGFVATYVDKLITFTSGAPVDTAGQLTGTQASPRWRWSASALYTNGPLSVRALVNYIGKGKYNNAFGPADINKNNYPAYAYLDLSAQYDVTEALQLFAKVENALDKDPPILATDVIIRAHPSGASNFYDLLGRNFGVGLRYRW